MRSEYAVSNALCQYGDTVRRICFCHLNTRENSEDIFQEVFLKYMLAGTEFSSPEHKKAWLIRVAVNTCNNLNRRLFHQKHLPLEVIQELPVWEDFEKREILSAVLSLPQRKPVILPPYRF